jgi:hypothetical protein
MPLHNKVAISNPLLVEALVLLSAIAVSGIVSIEANPYFEGGTIRPPSDAVPLIISVASPEDGSLYKTNSVNLAFTVSSQKTSLNCITRVRYTADWVPDEVCVYQQDSVYPEFPTFIEHNMTYEVPDGEHSFVISAGGPGTVVRDWTMYGFSMDTCMIVNFTVDTTAPSLSVLSPENKTYDTANVTLNVTASEAVSQVSYVLDGGENQTFEGNTTLTGLSNGEHNVTVYATDIASNNGASETRYFNIDIPDPFPTALAIASAAAAVAVTAGILVYFKKRRR